MMTGFAIIKANMPKPSITKSSLNNLHDLSAQGIVKKASLNPKEAKYYKVIEE
jgi:hypothetical protein